MDSDRLVVVGSGPTAVGAATAYREAGGGAAVVLVSSDVDAPYDRPPLSKEFLRGDVEERDLPLERPASYDDLGVELRLATTVRALDPHGRVLTLDGGGELSYGTCVLATGSRPRRIDVPGADEVLVLRSLADARRLRSAAESARTAVVVGSGFIGCEAAASLARRGLAVTQVTDEHAPQTARLGPWVGERIASWLRADGVRLLTGAAVQRFSALADARWRVDVAGQEPIEADLVLLATGVAPNGELAAEAGLAMERGRIVVDERMRTAVAGLLAAGDVAYAHNPAAGRHLTVEHWGEAEAMGRVAGTTAAGGEATWAEGPGFWSDIGGRTLQYVAWGDGYDRAVVDEAADGGAFNVWYAAGDGTTVGVLTYEREEDYERGRELVESGRPVPR